VLACVDVGYAERDARAACVVFARWEDEAPAEEHVVEIDDPAPYVPGEFYKRELPCLLRVLELVRAPLEVIVIDGYVTLDPEGRPGLGARLFEALGGSTAIVGVAKTSFATATHAVAVKRGRSEKPIFVTARGLSEATAAAYVERMHGDSRIPTLLRRVDRLSRGSL
jgi:deoxyribonuclease V